MAAIQMSQTSRCMCVQKQLPNCVVHDIFMNGCTALFEPTFDSYLLSDIDATVQLPKECHEHSVTMKRLTSTQKTAGSNSSNVVREFYAASRKPSFVTATAPLEFLFEA